jgi:hypothetical protein
VQRSDAAKLTYSQELVATRLRLAYALEEPSIGEVPLKHGRYRSTDKS